MGMADSNDKKREGSAAMDMERRWGRSGALRLLLAGALLSGLLAGCSSRGASGGGNAAASAAAAPAAKAAAPLANANGVVSDMAKVAVADQNAAAPSDPGPQAAGGAASSGSSAAESAAAGMTPPIAADASDGFNRKLIYKANLVMEVADYGAAQTKLRNLAALSGAYILQFSETTNDHERSGNYTIKVAAKGFASFLDGLGQISPSLQRSVQGQDVTEEYVDLDARLKAKQEEETRLLAFMDKAQKADDLVAFSNQLDKVQTDIEQIKGRMRYLDQNVALSTVELRLYQPLAGAGLRSGTAPFGQRLQHALDGSFKATGEIAQGAVIVVAALLPLLVLCAILLAVYLWLRSRRARKLRSVRAELRRELPAVESPEGGTDAE
jgi:hypothetical protein